MNTIALIDSGANPLHSHVQGVEGGLSFYTNSQGQIKKDSDFKDNIGHGTAVAGVIKNRVPNARIYAVRIFHDELNAPVSLLLAALEWAIENHMKIIHLSLGTTLEEYRSDLESLCRRAYDNGSVILAAARTPDDHVFPSVFDTVIGVCWNHECSESAIVYNPGKLVEFGAWGWARELPGLPRERNFHGSSFAVAQVTARTAEILEKYPNMEMMQVKEMLTKMAVGS